MGTNINIDETFAENLNPNKLASWISRLSLLFLLAKRHYLRVCARTIRNDKGRYEAVSISSSVWDNLMYSRLIKYCYDDCRGNFIYEYYVISLARLHNRFFSVFVFSCQSKIFFLPLNVQKYKNYYKNIIEKVFIYLWKIIRVNRICEKEFFLRVLYIYIYIRFKKEIFIEYKKRNFIYLFIHSILVFWMKIMSFEKTCTRADLR